ncbi:hypothetical protein L2046_09725, partial [Lactobacillus gasseri]|nr:hypothetical protein [Lactobacillus gasseri]
KKQDCFFLPSGERPCFMVLFNLKNKKSLTLQSQTNIKIKKEKVKDMKASKFMSFNHYSFYGIF